MSEMFMSEESLGGPNDKRDWAVCGLGIAFVSVALSVAVLCLAGCSERNEVKGAVPTDCACGCCECGK